MEDIAFMENENYLKPKPELVKNIGTIFINNPRESKN